MKGKLGEWGKVKLFKSYYNPGMMTCAGHVIPSDRGSVPVIPRFSPHAEDSHLQHSLQLLLLLDYIHMILVQDVSCVSLFSDDHLMIPRVRVLGGPLP